MCSFFYIFYDFVIALLAVIPLVPTVERLLQGQVGTFLVFLSQAV